MAHTKGPWEIYNGVKGVGVTATHGWDIAHCCGDSSNRSDAEIIANANLIAASPELFRACEKVLQYLVLCGKTGGPTLRSLEAAIKKAKGECL